MIRNFHFPQARNHTLATFVIIGLVAVNILFVTRLLIQVGIISNV